MTQTELQKMLAGELYDALDPELVERRTRARDLCQDAERHPRKRRPTSVDAFSRSYSARRRQRCGCSRPSTATTAPTSSSASACSSTSTASCWMSAGDDRRLHAVRAGGADLHAIHPLNAGAAPHKEYGKPVDDRLGRVGRRRGDHSARASRSDREP